MSNDDKEYVTEISKVFNRWVIDGFMDCLKKISIVIKTSL